MDIYAVFITGHLFLPDPAVDPDKIGREPRKEAAGQHLNWLKWSSAATYLGHGKEPLPILTAIRHERS